MESSNPPNDDQSIYPPSEWLSPRYDPWINTPGTDEVMGEQISDPEQPLRKERATGEIILIACRLGYITPDDLIEFDGNRQTVLDGIAAYIEKSGDNATEVLKSWGVEYPGKTE